MEGKTARGASSPAKPALHMPEPLSTTMAATCVCACACGRGEESMSDCVCYHRRTDWGHALAMIVAALCLGKRGKAKHPGERGYILQHALKQQGGGLSRADTDLLLAGHVDGLLMTDGDV